MDDSFAQDMLIQILLQLPVKTLVACCCVCKLWRKIITDTSFIVKYSSKTHLDHRHQHAYLFLKIYAPPKKWFWYSKDVDPAVAYIEWTYENLSKIMSAQETDCRYQNNDWVVHVGGFCKGLICLTTPRKPNVFIVNPSLHRVTPLPTLITHNECFGGIGYDHFYNDYKVLMFSYRRRAGRYRRERDGVSLYSLNKNSWKDISDISQHTQYSRLYKRCSCLNLNQVFIGRFLHWLAWAKTGNSRPAIVMRFDVTHEVFDTMCFPIDVGDYPQLGLSIAIVFGKFCLSHYGSNHVWSIWLMNEYGVEKSWTRQFRLDWLAIDAAPVHSIVGSNANGELLFENPTLETIHSFHPKSNKVKNLNVVSHENLYVDNFEESLVLLDREWPS